MDKNITYYDVLEIAEDASAEDIRQAYRKLIKIWHPDLHPGDEKAALKTQEINEAYDVLSDPVKKEQYDEYLSLTRPFQKRESQTPSPDADDEFDVEYGDMSFKDYSEYVSSAATKAYKDSSRPQSSRVDTTRYSGHSNYGKSSMGSSVNLLPLVRVFSIIILVILLALLIIRQTGIIPELENNDGLPFPVLLMVVSIPAAVVLSFIMERRKK